jgi:DNA transposition AAA+ family ATPase
MLIDNNQVPDQAEDLPVEAAGEKGWDAVPQEPPLGFRSNQDIDEWRDVRSTIRMLAADENWSMAAVARLSGVPHPTFSAWYSGKYKGVGGNVTSQLTRWIRADEERRRMTKAIDEPGFVETPTALEVLDALLYAQELPGLALITLGPGMGKTRTVKHVLATRPNTFAVTASPSTRTVGSINHLIVDALGLTWHPHHARSRIGERLRRAGRHTLLMVDEAQNLTDETVDELRHFTDEYGCGLALLGNRDVIGRWGRSKPKEGYGQLQRRISLRVDRVRPQKQDIELFIAAWGIENPDVVRLLNVIGMKPGALGQITETLKLAAIRARHKRRDLAAEDVKWAWSQRADEGDL